MKATRDLTKYLGAFLLVAIPVFGGALTSLGIYEVVISSESLKQLIVRRLTVDGFIAGLGLFWIVSMLALGYAEVLLVKRWSKPSRLPPVNPVP
jgi:hypothetical protein